MSDLPPDDLLAQATCAVLIGGQPVATAWLVSDEGYVLTAGHVLCKDEAGQEFYNEVQVEFSQDIPRKAREIVRGFQREKGIDFAVLKLTSMPPNRQPLPVSLIRSVRGTFILRGYGETLKDPATGMGNFTGVVDRQSNPDYRLFRLSSKALADRGFSGGAVYSEKERGGVGAVVAIQIEAGEDPFSPAGNTVLAMPLYRVAEYWGELKKLAAVSPPPPERPEPPIISTLSPQAQEALKTCFQRNRPQILDALPANQYKDANQQMDALHRTFLNAPPDLGTIRSTLAFLGDYPSALGHLKMLLQEPTLQRLVRRGGGEEMRREYERMVFGGG